MLREDWWLTAELGAAVTVIVTALPVAVAACRRSKAWGKRSNVCENVGLGLAAAAPQERVGEDVPGWVNWQNLRNGGHVEG